MYDFILRNGKVLTPEGIIKADIAIKNGLISSINQNITESAKNSLDIDSKIIIPGIIDAHVHLREPGGEQNETILTGTKAAVSGGVTTVLDMPNTNPAIVTQEMIDKKREIAKKTAFCNIGFYLGLTDKNYKSLDKIKNYAAIKIYMGSSTGSLLFSDPSKIMEVLKSTDKNICVHAEDEDLINQAKDVYKDENNPEIHSCIRHRGCAEKAVSRLIELSEKTGGHIHICHLSTREELDLVRDAKKRGVNITCEVCPHHLFLNDAYYGSLKNLAKVNPPLRSEDDNKYLLEGLNDGTVDIITTDHAPHSLVDKKKDYWQAPAGVPQVELLLPLMMTAVNEGKIGFQKCIELLSKKPANLFKISNKGEIKKGYDADLTIIDLNKKKTVKTGNLHSKCNWTPYNNWELNGWPLMTLIKGQVVYNGKEFFKPENIDLVG